MKKIKVHLIISFLLAMEIAFSQNITEKDFKNILDEAITYTINWRTNSLDNNLGITPIKSVKKIAQNTWQIEVTSINRKLFREDSYYNIFSHKIILKNFSTYMEAVSVSQLFHKDHLAAIENHEDVKDFQESELGSYSDDLKLTRNKTDAQNQYMYNYVYKYNDIDASDLESFLVSLINFARLLSYEYGEVYFEHIENYVEELDSKGLSKLNVSDYMFLMRDEDLLKMKEDHDDALATWRFDHNGMAFNLYFYKDRIKYLVTRDIGEGYSDSERMGFKNELQTYSDDNKIDNVSTMEATYFPNYETYLGISFIFNLNDEISGAELREAYENIVFEFSEDLYGAIAEVVNN